MIDRAQIAALTPARRAQLIYSTAQAELSTKLWRAALGDAGSVDQGGLQTVSTPMPQDSFMALLTTLQPGADRQQASFAASTSVPVLQPLDIAPVSTPSPAVAPASTTTGLKGPNAHYWPSFAEAAARTGVPPSALAAIVGAEAGKHSDGSWNPMCRNPRSNATGLGQFLSGTWQHLAETGGTWLNDVARANGWICANGKVRPEARGQLLGLRNDPVASINAVADYASANLDQLERKGLSVGDDPLSIARAAYLGHHLGLGDAARFLRAAIPPGRARMLLTAQIGPAAAGRWIARAGDAALAHRQWLLSYIDRHIAPSRLA